MEMMCEFTGTRGCEIGVEVVVTVVRPDETRGRGFA